MKRKFWNWVKNETDESAERTLYLDGEISDETWYGDEVTPKLFKDEPWIVGKETYQSGSIALAATSLRQHRFITCSVIIKEP